MPKTPDRSFVVLDTKTWIWLIALIVGACMANVGAMQALDWRWQTRTEQLSREIREEIKEVQRSIPPDWFRKMVEANAEAIKKLDERMDNNGVGK